MKKEVKLAKRRPVYVKKNKEYWATRVGKKSRELSDISSAAKRIDSTEHHTVMGNAISWEDLTNELKKSKVKVIII